MWFYFFTVLKNVMYTIYGNKMLAQNVSNNKQNLNEKKFERSSLFCKSSHEKSNINKKV